MVHAEVLAKIKELKLHAHKILQSSSGGVMQSKQHGFGFDFDQLRNYSYGDDVRRIDWKSSARNPHSLFVRQYFQERNGSYLVCLDISKSMSFSSDAYTKLEMLQQVAGSLILAASWYKDRIGLLLFDGAVQLYIPPARGIAHMNRLLSELFSAQPKSCQTDFNELSNYIVKHVSSKTALFIVSDFIDEKDGVKNLFKKITINREVVSILATDKHETSFVDVGYLWMQDLETGVVDLVDSKQLVKNKFDNLLLQRKKALSEIMMSHRVDFLELTNYQTCMYDLLKFFHKRMLS